MKYKEPSPEEYIHIAEKVRSGEYFREAKRMYDITVNDPMAERYFYVFVTGVALLTFLCALFAAQSLLPLSRSVPFVYMLNDVVDDLPSIAPLRTNPSQSVDEAVVDFLAKTFVEHYESYSIDKLERNYGGIESAASPEVFADYQRMLATSNPESPVIRFQRHSRRLIDIIAVRHPALANTLEVEYYATIYGPDAANRTRHKATLTYKFGGVSLNEETGEAEPLQFKVTSYSSTLQESS